MRTRSFDSSETTDPDRRGLLLGGAAIVVAASGGTLRWAHAEEVDLDHPAYGPWRDWDKASPGTPMALVRAAVVAANAYNTQPWLFRVSERRIDILADPTRNLGAFDGHLREMHFSLGCALQNLLLAAPQNGYAAKVVYAPGRMQPASAGPAPRLGVSVALSRAPNRRTRPSELYEAIGRRHTNRNPMDTARPVPAAVKAAMQAMVKGSDARLFLFDTPDDRHKVAESILASNDLLRSDPEVLRGLAPFTRRTLDEELTHRDGSYTAPPPGRTTSMSYAELFPSAQAFGVIAVRDRFDIGQAVRAGKLWQGLHLLITARGLAARPSNALPELLDHEAGKPDPATAAGVLELIGDAAWQPMFMFYMGYPTAISPPSARRSVDKAVIA
jgi:nitroreductase